MPTEKRSLKEVLLERDRLRERERQTDTHTQRVAYCIFQDIKSGLHYFHKYLPFENQVQQKCFSIKLCFFFLLQYFNILSR